MKLWDSLKGYVGRTGRRGNVGGTIKFYPAELDGKKLVKLTKYYKSKIRGFGDGRKLAKVLTYVGFSLSGIYADYKWKIENSGWSDPLYEFPIDELIPDENHSSFKYSVEDKSLVIDKFKSERTLYIGNYPDSHIQKRQREMWLYHSRLLLRVVVILTK